MNCKPGDLAIQVGGFTENIGAIVGVVNVHHGDWWEVEVKGRPLLAKDINTGEMCTTDSRKGSIVVAKDCWLRPLRDSDGQDETIAWKRREHA